MKFAHIAAAGLLAACASAFQTSLPGQDIAAAQRVRLGPLSMQTMGGTTIDLRPSSNGRDVNAMEQWARNCGVQIADGVQLTSLDGQEWGVTANGNIPAGSPVLFVPAEMILSSGAAQQEFGGMLEQSEQALAQVGATNRLPLFRLMVKILSEYEKGDQSPYFPWLNSMPRMFYNGVAMTDACFACLPPYVAGLAMKERENFAYFVQALRIGNPPISGETLNNDDLLQWAYNVALTRHNVVIPAQEKKISPMADMFNHGTYPNVEITYDENGNCLATAVQDVSPGMPLTVSLGDPTNPSPMFATYGFLDDDCPGIFCKAMEHEEEMKDLSYGYKDLLFGTETGAISPQVWDLFLYKLLRDNNDDNAANFLLAVRNNDEGTKQQISQQYFPYTLQALREHVDNIIWTVDQLTMRAESYERRAHPRVPIIVAHNDLVKETFIKVKQQLDAMG